MNEQNPSAMETSDQSLEGASPEGTHLYGADLRGATKPDGTADE
jgi:hypothetical protein